MKANGSIDGSIIGKKSIFIKEENLTIFISPDKRVNRLVQENPMLYKIFIDKDKEIGNQIRVEESDFSEVVEINCFTKQDLLLPFVDKSLPYVSKWLYVDDIDEFIFEGERYKIFFDYKLYCCPTKSFRF